MLWGGGGGSEKEVHDRNSTRCPTMLWGGGLGGSEKEVHDRNSTRCPTVLHQEMGERTA